MYKYTFGNGKYLWTVGKMSATERKIEEQKVGAKVLKVEKFSK